MQYSLIGSLSSSLRLLLGGLLALVVTGGELRSEVIGVWALGDGEKVFRFDVDHLSRERNSVWDGHTIRLKGLYNEVLAFQVIVVADNQGASGVEIVVDPPIHADSGIAIGGGIPTNFGPRGSIEVFSEHYIRVRTPTPPSWIYESAAAAPEKMTGWIPDALIPVNALPGRGGQPLDIPRTRLEERRIQKTVEITPAAPRQNQGFWIDVHLPRDRSFPSGVFRGSVRVLTQGKVVSSLPLEIELLPHYLPDQNHATVWMFSADVEPYFPELTPAQVEKMIKFEGHRHRIDMAGGFKANRSQYSGDMLDDYLPYLNGCAYTPEEGYQGPGEGQGERIFPIGIYGSITNSAFADESSARVQSDQWVEWFEANAPEVVFFWYIIDEPGEIQFSWIAERASWIHENPGPGSRLPVFTTRSYTEELGQSIDLWAGNDGVRLNASEDMKEIGKRHWFYNGKRPHWGSTPVEMAAVDLRMISWVQYIASLETWFYWHGTQWTHNSQGPKGRLHQRVFNAPVTFTSDGTDQCNGCGVMFYPGRMPFYPDEDRGVSALLPSIRLKNIRRGRQDYELMWLAEQASGREEVLRIVRRPLPRILDEVGSREAVAWSQRGDDFDFARGQLLQLLGNHDRR